MRKKRETKIKEQAFYLSLEDRKGNSIGVEKVVADHIPRKGETLEFFISNIAEVKTSIGDTYGDRGWTEDLIDHYIGSYVVERVVNKVSSVKDRIESKPYVCARLIEHYIGIPLSDG